MTSDDYKWRKELAQAAMAAILSNPEVVRRYNVRPYGEGFGFNFEMIARDAFEVADSIIEHERKEKPFNPKKLA